MDINKFKRLVGADDSVRPNILKSLTTYKKGVKIINILIMRWKRRNILFILRETPSSVLFQKRWLDVATKSRLFIWEISR